MANLRAAVLFGQFAFDSFLSIGIMDFVGLGQTHEDGSISSTWVIAGEGFTLQCP